MANMPDDEVPRNDKLLEIDAFLNVRKDKVHLEVECPGAYVNHKRSLPAPVTSEERLAEIKALGAATRELSHQFTNLVQLLVDQENAKEEALKGDRSSAKARLAKLEEELGFEN